MATPCELRFRDELYTGDLIKSSYRSVDFIVDLLKQGKSVFDVILICKCEGSANFLEIIPSTEIFKAVYSYKIYEVIGIALGKKEAFGMISAIYSDFTGMARL